MLGTEMESYERDTEKEMYLYKSGSVQMTRLMEKMET
jgi:hypothetical protein